MKRTRQLINNKNNTIAVPAELWLHIMADSISAAWASTQCAQLRACHLVCRQWHQLMQRHNNCVDLLTHLSSQVLYKLLARRASPVALERVQHVHYHAVHPQWAYHDGCDGAVLIQMRHYVTQRLPALRSLRLTFQHAWHGNDGLALSQLTGLRSLSLINASLSADDWAAMRDRLHELDLSQEYSHGAINDAVLGQLTALRALALGSNTAISSVALRSLTALTRLDLRSNQRVMRPVGSQGHFDGLTHLSRLTDLTLSRADFRCTRQHLWGDVQLALPSVKYFRLVNKYDPVVFPAL